MASREYRVEFLDALEEPSNIVVWMSIEAETPSSALIAGNQYFATAQAVHGAKTFRVVDPITGNPVVRS